MLATWCTTIDMQSNIRTLLLVLTLVLATDVSADEFRWLNRVDDAVRQARTTDRLILVDLYADWCGWCKTLERDVFTTKTFRDFAKDYVLLRVDVEDRGEGSRLQVQYKVSSLPTMLIIDADQIHVGSVPGYSPAPAYVASLRAEVQRYRASLLYFEQAHTSPDPAVLEKLARTLHQRGDGARAVVLYRRLLEGLRGGSPVMGQMQFLLADAERLAGDFAAAGSAVDRARTLAAQQSNAALQEEAELLAAQIAQDAGNCEQAESTLRRFIEAHPQSPRRLQAKKVLGALERGDLTCS